MEPKMARNQKPFSTTKLIAIVLLIGIIPALSFYIGKEFQSTVNVLENEQPISMVISTTTPLLIEQNYSTSTPIGSVKEAPQQVNSKQGTFVVSSGKSFGQCIGYCRSEITVSQKSTDFTTEAQGRNTTALLPSKEDHIATNPSLWSKIVSLLDTKKVGALPERIGCPDCADGGAEWITIIQLSTSSPQKVLFSKKVTFEYNMPPKELEALASLLREERTKFENEIKAR